MKAKSERSKILEENQKEKLDIFAVEVQNLKVELAILNIDRDDTERNKDLLSYL